MASSRRIRILFKTTTNLHDLERLVQLASLLDLLNCLRQSADEGRGDPDKALMPPPGRSRLTRDCSSEDGVTGRPSVAAMVVVPQIDGVN